MSVRKASGGRGANNQNIHDASVYPRLRENTAKVGAEKYCFRIDPVLSTPDPVIGETLRMLFDAHFERDEFRVDAAMRHLEFIAAITGMEVAR